MDQASVVKIAQFVLLIAIAVAVAVALIRVAVKYKVHREVYGKHLNNYIEAKVLEKQFEANRSKDIKK